MFKSVQMNAFSIAHQMLNVGLEQIKTLLQICCWFVPVSIHFLIDISTSARTLEL